MVRLYLLLVAAYAFFAGHAGYLAVTLEPGFGFRKLAALLIFVTMFCAMFWARRAWEDWR